MDDLDIVHASLATYDEGYPNSYVMASAIIYKGTMYLGMRHSHCLRQAYNEHQVPIRQEADGFVDNHFNFLNREEALKLAIKTGQVKSSHNGRELYSEDLW